MVRVRVGDITDFIPKGTCKGNDVGTFEVPQNPRNPGCQSPSDQGLWPLGPQKWPSSCEISSRVCEALLFLLFQVRLSAGSKILLLAGLFLLSLDLLDSMTPVYRLLKIAYSPPSSAALRISLAINSRPSSCNHSQNALKEG